MTAHHAHVRPAELLGFSLPSPSDREGFGRRKKELLARLREDEVRWELLGPHVAFDARAYVRKRLYRDRSWEVLLLCWLPGNETVIHDHGGSWGAVAILAGTLEEDLFAWRGEGRPLELRRQRDLAAPRVTQETLPTIHRVANRSARPALSLHFYSPPLTRLNSYDGKLGVRHEVQLDVGPAVAVGGDPGLRPARMPAASGEETLRVPRARRDSTQRERALPQVSVPRKR